MTDSQPEKKEEVPSSHNYLDLTRQETKALYRSKKQLELQRSDLMIKKKVLDESLQEIHELLSGLNKVFVPNTK